VVLNIKTGRLEKSSIFRIIDNEEIIIEDY
jgi:hypothetical protein